jgi:hypothetical protein
VNGSYYYPTGEEKYSVNVRDTWTEENRNAKYPRLTTSDAANNYVTSDFWLRKISRFDLTRVQLTYDFPSSMFDGISWLSGASVYVSGSNLLTISKESDFLNLNVGADPQTRFYNLGVKVNF